MTARQIVLGSAAGTPHGRHAINQEGALVSTNATIEEDIRAALVLDPRIPDPDEIAVSAEAGAATLRGTVGSFGQRRAAVGDTRDVAGVYDVYDELEVRLLNDARRDDTDIRGIALQILMWDVDVPAEMIEVKVSDGWITLSGELSYQFESDAAYDDVASLFGVVGITNEIKVITP
jgi:osmotically-inducible protein OsmY